MAPEQDVTQMLVSVKEGAPGATDRLIAAVYDELRAMAGRRMAAERAGHTLQPTALVHEAYLRLVDSRVPWQNRWHFFAAAAEAMRRILIDRARRKKRIRHGAGAARVGLDEAPELAIESGLDSDALLALDRALDELATLDARKAEVVKLRFFAGLEISEVAEALGVSVTTVKSDWTFSRAWLKTRLDGAELA